ncbi:MAG: hypothetical protein CMJ05_07040 [Pelagibacterales bacterium]|nr:hypothetical protein [Pelagibacterales bacterium]
MRALIFTLIYLLISTSILQANNIRFKKDVLLIKTKTSEYIFNIELAVSPQERSKGLMDRSSIRQNEGMLFIYPKNQVIKMWMKNTLIPLDMIFIRDNGEIEKIIKMTTPKDLTVIGPEVKLKAVLEINGGITSYLNIKKGDYVIYKSFIKRN